MRHLFFARAPKGALRPLASRLLLLSSLVLTSACSEAPAAAPNCPSGTCPQGKKDAGDDADESMDEEEVDDPWDALGDAGQTGGPLAASLSVNGENRVCGDCAVVTARASGGETPYKFSWNDPTLSGPGPHEICAAESRDIQLTVSDASRGEFASEPQTASATLACQPPAENKGPGLSGCKLMFDASILSPLNPAGPYVERMYGCTDLHGGPGLDSAEVMALGNDAGTLVAQGINVKEGMRAGESYEFIFELLFPLSIGGNLTMELWGSREGCALDEKLGELKIDGSTSKQSTCLSLEHDYDKLLTKPSEDSEAPAFSLSFGVSMTLCSGCKASAP
jgi:hypothetical protein